MTEEKKEVTPQEYWAGFPEAPVSSTFKWTDAQGFDHMTTFRAWTGSQLLQIVDKFVNTLADIGGRPYGSQANKPVPPTVESEFPPAQDAQGVSWRYKSGALDMYKGKLHLNIHAGAVEPNEIACPIHQGATLKRRSNEKGSWMSHKDGENWCTAAFEHVS